MGNFLGIEDCTLKNFLMRMFLKCVIYFPYITQSSGPQPFSHQGPVSWKTVFPWIGVGGDGFGMIQAHYVYCALYFCYYYLVIYNEIIIQLTIMLTGGGAQVVMRAMGSSCKYTRPPLTSCYAARFWGLGTRDTEDEIRMIFP